MEGLASAPWIAVVKPVAVALLLGLPVMTVFCFWQTAQSRTGGDEAMARSWSDAAKSFLGMTLASWMLGAGMVWVLRTGLDYLVAELQRG
jgi:hypothetical protein